MKLEIFGGDSEAIRAGKRADYFTKVSMLTGKAGDDRGIRGGIAEDIVVSVRDRLITAVIFFILINNVTGERS